MLPFDSHYDQDRTGVSAIRSWVPRLTRKVRRMTLLDASTRELALRLGLGDLNKTPRCCGYQNGCGCEDCLAFEDNVSPVFRKWLERDPDDPIAMPRLIKRAGPHPRQPWEIAA